LGHPEFIPKQEGYNLVTILAPLSEQQKEKLRKQREAQNLQAEEGKGGEG